MVTKVNCQHYQESCLRSDSHMGRELVKAMAPVDVDHLGRVDEELLVRVHGEQHVAHVCLEQKHLTLLSGRKKRQGTCACLPLMYPNPSGPISNFLAYDRRDLHRLLLFLDIVVPKTL